MELIDLNDVKPSRLGRAYGGNSGRKLSVSYNGDDYLLKFPNKVTDPKLKEKLGISYTSSPISEYISSGIYRSLGIPVHDTILGFRDNHIVVLCRDFIPPGQRLQEFRELRTTFDLRLIGDDDVRQRLEDSSGNSTILSDCIEIIRHHPAFEGIREEAIRRFWDMFVIDAYVSNNDRNNGNWGIIKDEIGNTPNRLAPVYDNGNSLYDKWNDSRILEELRKDDEQFKHDHVDSKICIYLKDDGVSRINPNHYILSLQNEDCNQAVIRFRDNYYNGGNRRISELIKEAPGVSKEQMAFIARSLDTRWQNVLKVAYQKIMDRGYEKSRKKAGKCNDKTKSLSDDR